MTGMSRTTGAVLADIEHIAQSIADILTTPLGSRLARRTYGSRVFDLLDAPVNASTRVRLFAATATALAGLAGVGLLGRRRRNARCA